MKTIPLLSHSIPLLAQLATLLTSTIMFANEPLRIESQKQLFIGPFDESGCDTYLVESMTNVEMTMNPALVTGERLVAQDKPWEGTGILDMRQFVLKDGDTFRMYYNALPHHFVSKDPKDPRKNIWGRPYNRILCYADRLELNVDTSAGGTVFVEVQDEARKAIVGFTAEDADEINGNYIRKVATWNGSSDVSSLTGRVVRLRFLMRDTKLYSFQFTAKESR